MLERLAKFVHEQMWMTWSAALMRDNVVTEERASRWRPLHVPYEELTEEEKDKDRFFARGILKEIEKGGSCGNYHIRMFPSSIQVPVGGDACKAELDPGK
jgi:hypothetical protein